MAQVTLKNVSKQYPNSTQPAVRDCTFEVRDREFVVLVGPSGCGKSTTLRMIAGLETPTSGEVYIGDRLVNDVAPKDRDIAMVFQNYALYPHMTVYRNMAFGLILRKFPRAEIDRRVRDAANILGLTEFLDRRPKALSGGQRQRVAVGRAIVRQPQVFLFDEPLSNLDAKMRVQMRAEIGRLRQALQATMIYVTHDQVEAMTMGDRIVVMNDGSIQQIGEPMTLYDRPANRFVAGFIGSPAMNFFEGEIVEEGGGRFFRTDAMNLRLDRGAAGGSPPGRITLGLRPEHLKLAADAHAGPGIDAVVDVVEPMGAEVYFHLTAGAHRFIARLEGHARAMPGETATLAPEMARALFFDPASGAAVR